MTKDEQRLLGSLESKLDSLHEDVKSLRQDVDDLKQDFVKRTLVYKIISWVIGIVTTLGTIVFNVLMHKGP